MPDMPFKLNKCLQVKPDPTQMRYLYVAPLMALTTNIRLGWKDLPGPNIIAY